MSCVATISDSNVFAPSCLGKLTVTYDGHDFSVTSSKGLKSLQRADLSKDLRGISTETLQKMMEVGYLSITKTGEDYAMNFKGRLLGGGLLGAIGVYVGTTVAGGAMIVAGTLLTPVGGVGLTLIAAGTTTIAAAPTTFLVTLPTPTP